MNYHIVRPSGEVLATATTAGAALAQHRARQSDPEPYSVIDKDGGMVTETELEQLWRAEQRGEI